MSWIVWPLKKGPIFFAETSANNRLYTQPRISKERRSRVHRDGSLKSLNVLAFYVFVTVMLMSRSKSTKLNIERAATRVCFAHCCCLHFRECYYKLSFIFTYSHSRSCLQRLCQAPTPCRIIVILNWQPFYSIDPAAEWHIFISALVVGGVVYYFVWCRFAENVGHVTLRLPYVGGPNMTMGSIMNRTPTHALYVQHYIILTCWFH